MESSEIVDATKGFAFCVGIVSSVIAMGFLFAYCIHVFQKLVG